MIPNNSFSDRSASSFNGSFIGDNILLPSVSQEGKMGVSNGNSSPNSNQSSIFGTVVKKLSNLTVSQALNSSDTSESSTTTSQSLYCPPHLKDETLTLTRETAVKLLRELAKVRDDTSKKVVSTYNTTCAVYREKAVELTHLAIRWLETSRNEDGFSLIRAVLTFALPLELDKTLFTAFTSTKAIEEQVNGCIMNYLAKEIKETDKDTLFREDSGDLRLFRAMQTGYLSGTLRHIREQTKPRKVMQSSENIATCCALCLKKAIENDAIPDNLLKIYSCLYRSMFEKYKSRRTSTLFIAQSVFLRSVNPFIVNLEVDSDKQEKFSKKYLKITKHIQKACAESVNEETLTRRVIKEFADMLENKLMKTDPSIDLLVNKYFTDTQTQKQSRSSKLKMPA